MRAITTRPNNELTNFITEFLPFKPAKMKSRFKN
jgi:hypothetical protein